MIVDLTYPTIICHQTIIEPQVWLASSFKANKNNFKAVNEVSKDKKFLIIFFNVKQHKNIKGYFSLG